MLSVPRGLTPRAVKLPTAFTYARWRRPSSNVAPNTSKPFYVTTPIFYPNSVPHIGHLYSLVVADIFSRYNKLCHPELPAHFITGTDEHGWKIQRSAEQKGMEPLAFCDQLSVHFRELVKKANVNVTRFTRTSEEEHCNAVHHLWRQLEAKNLIYKGQHDGWYSISDECFYTESQITKITSPSGAETVQKDDYMAIETSSRVERLTEENYKFRLSEFRDQLLSYYKQNPDVIYPPQQYEDVLQMLSEPLNDLSISRPRERLHWGIPVPSDPGHTIYVWIDALTTYLSSVGYPWPSGDTGFSYGWPPNLQVIGKDILRFHAIYLPAILMALDIPQAQRILSHAHWTVEYRKMSKSLGNVVDPVKAIDQYGIDVVRYYLARVGGRFKGDISWDSEQLEKVSKEISSLLGNLFLRITSKSIQIRALKGEKLLSSTKENGIGEESAKLIGKLQNLRDVVQQNMNALVPAEALEEITLVLREANAVVTFVAPWSKTTPLEAVHGVHVLTLECLRVCGTLLQPFMPAKSTQLLDALGIPEKNRFMEDAVYDLGRVQLERVTPGIKLF
ncbi:tRNA synthetases class I (M)-domain-containing protein [Cristinia sonorae]|uniref:Probable methionine--tRNA ligase, mitochondrial n=1 Tax=Cristinia sonorae TaxID=1940300 RepID=A0A8K0XN99_9AGAR|nr:tRNA synthetases class I (M)-domain-containing protein [Cristinia sonorae]